MRRWSVAAVLALGIVLVGAACGTGSEPKAAGRSSKVSTAALLAAAPGKAAEAGGARFEMTMTVPTGKDDAVVRASGIVDLRRGDMQMSMNMRDFAPALPSADVEMRMVDGVIYMNFGDLADRMGLGDTPWLKLDPAAFGVPDSAMRQQQNPADLLQTLRGIGDVEAVGSATVRGVDTTEYRGTVDLRKALDGLGPDVTDAMKRQLGQLGVASMPVRVWVDGDGLPRREEIELSAGGQTVSARIDFFDYGADVSVQTPPADQIGELTDLLGSGTANAA